MIPHNSGPQYPRKPPTSACPLPVIAVQPRLQQPYLAQNQKSLHLVPGIAGRPLHRLDLPLNPMDCQKYLNKRYYLLFSQPGFSHPFAQ
jgi:hypothetical protein